jgi:integrase
MWDPNELSRQWTRLVQRKKLVRLRFHDLRHGTACLLLQAGCSLSEVSDTLGHTSLAITKAFYARYEEGLKRDRADALDALLDGSQTSNRKR